MKAISTLSVLVPLLASLATAQESVRLVDCDNEVTNQHFSQIIYFADDSKATNGKPLAKDVCNLSWRVGGAWFPESVSCAIQGHKYFTHIVNPTFKGRNGLNGLVNDLMTGAQYECAHQTNPVLYRDGDLVCTTAHICKKSDPAPY